MGKWYYGTVASVAVVWQRLFELSWRRWHRSLAGGVRRLAMQTRSKILYTLAALLLLVLLLTILVMSTPLRRFFVANKVNVEERNTPAKTAATGLASGVRLQLEQAHLIWDPPKENYSCQASGTTDFEDGAILQLTWKRLTCIYTINVAETRVQVMHGKFMAAFGPFPASRPVIPGTYQMAVFFSPSLQKLPGSHHFTKHSLTFSLGTNQDYANLFAQEESWLKEFLQDIRHLQQKIGQSFWQAKAAGKGDQWYQGRQLREKILQTLQKRETEHREKYLGIFFEKAFPHLYPLLNLLEDAVEDADAALAEDGAGVFAKRLNHFVRLYYTSCTDFRYEAIALAPQAAGSLGEGMRDWHDQCLTKAAQAPTLVPVERAALRLLALTFANLQQMQRSLQELPKTPSDSFILESNRWLFTLKNLLQDTELGSANNLWSEDTLYAPADCYFLAVALLNLWRQQAEQTQIRELTSNFSPSNHAFPAIWQRVADKYRLAQSFQESMILDLALFTRYVQELREELQQTPPAGDWQEKSAKRNAALVELQSMNRMLASLSPNRQANVLSQYLRFCSYFIYFQELLSQYWLNVVPLTTVQEEFKRLERQLEELRATVSQATLGK